MTQGSIVDLTQTLRAVEDAGLFFSLCTIKRRPDPPAVNSMGQANLSASQYSAVTGMVDIPCMLAPMRTKSGDKGAVVRGSEMTAETGDFHLLLDGYYPAILQHDIATVDGVDYQIVDPESDSQHVMTRAVLRTYTI